MSSFYMFHTTHPKSHTADKYRLSNDTLQGFYAVSLLKVDFQILTCDRISVEVFFSDCAYLIDPCDFYSV